MAATEPADAKTGERPRLAKGILGLHSPSQSSGTERPGPELPEPNLP
jgi:hypothetical protein